jgi:polysaccharide pyruvyl transferase WcaK-like protein
VQQGLAPVLGVSKEVLHFVVCLQYMARVNLLVIAGGGQLDDYWGGALGHPWSLWKWSLAAKLCRTRLVFASVGVGSIRSSTSAYLLRSALARAAYVSVRDPKSKSFVASTLRSPHAALVPDLAFSLSQAAELATRRRGRAAGQQPTVLVSPIGWKHPRLWPESDAAAYRTYVNGVSEAIAQLLDHGAAVRIVRSDAADIDSVKDLTEAVFTTAPKTTHARFTSATTDTVEQFLAELAGADIMIASRLHSVILAQASGVPVVALSYDMKVDEQMTLAGFTDDSLPIASFVPEELVARVQHRLTANGTTQRHATIDPSWVEALSAQFLALLGNSRDVQRR